jgi:hypothetical protein
MTYRFNSTTAVSAAVNSDKIIGALGSIATTTTNLSAYWATFKILRVRIWCAVAPVSGAPAKLYLNWFSSTFQASPNLDVSDSSTSYERPAYIDAVPPKGSQASFWNGLAAGTLFNIVSNCPIIFDLHVDAVASNAVTSLQTTITGPASVGVQYYLALDGSTNSLVPESLLTIS